MKKKFYLLTAPLLGALLFLMGSCSDNQLVSDDTPFFIAGSSNAAILENLGTNVILASYQALENSTGNLKSATASFALDPSEANLLALRVKYKLARAQLKHAQIIYFGPSSNNLYDANLDAWIRGFTICNRTTDCTPSVDSLVAAASPGITSSYLGSQGATLRGFTALEYLLYNDGTGAQGVSDAAVVASLTGRRAGYLIALVSDINSVATRLREGWDPGGDNFLNEFINPTGGGTYDDETDALSAAVSALLTFAEGLQDKQLGFPAGLSSKSGGSIHVDSVESPYSNLSIEDMLNSLDAMRCLYTGDFGDNQGFGLDESVRRTNAVLDSEIIAAMDNIAAKLKALRTSQGNLRTAISNDDPNVVLIHTTIKELRIKLTTDLVSTSGTTPGVSPNDGD